MTDLKKILLERANTISGLEKRLVENRNDKIAIQELKQQYDLFSEVHPEDVIPKPSIIIKNDVTGDSSINEQIAQLTQEYLDRKGRDYISFLEFKDNKTCQNFIIQNVSFDDAKKLCENLEKDEFYMIREDFSYKIVKQYEGKWKPVLQKRTNEVIVPLKENKDKHYRILGKKYKALF